MAGPTRLELATSCVTGSDSYRMSLVSFGATEGRESRKWSLWRFLNEILNENHSPQNIALFDADTASDPFRLAFRKVSRDNTLGANRRPDYECVCYFAVQKNR